MSLETTLFMIKPDCVDRRLIGDLIAVMEHNGFRVRNLKMFSFTREMAKEFYAEHEGKHFFNPLLNFMLSGPVVAVELEGENAVAGVREIMGATDPVEAASGTIRHKFASTQRYNCVHGSDSPGSAVRELKIVFGSNK